MHSVLDADSLATAGTAARLRVGLPWIRSLPLGCVRAISVEIDGDRVEPVVLLAGRRLSAEQLVAEAGWWYLQDRLVLEVPGLAAGEHDVVVIVQAMIPYLLAGPGGSALELPLRVAGRLELDHPSVPTVARAVA